MDGDREIMDVEFGTGNLWYGGHATCIMGIVPFFSLHFWRAFGHHSTSNGFGAMSSSFQAKQSPFGI